MERHLYLKFVKMNKISKISTKISLILVTFFFIVLILLIPFISAAQYARPSSTITSGSWTYSGSSLHEDTDEEAPDGVAYASSTTDEDECVLGLSSVIDPVSSSGHIIRFTARSVNGEKGGENLYVRLYQGDVLIASSAKITLNRNAYEEYTYTLLAEEADAIEDYGNLRIRLHVDAVGSGEEIRVDQVEFETPNEPAADTCSPSSPLTANHVFDCSDNCIQSTNLDAGGYNISIIGTGTFKTTANITNVNKLFIQGTDTNNICRVTCLDGGCFK